MSFEVVEVDAITGRQSKRQMSASEVAQYEASLEASRQRQQAMEKEAADRQAARQSAIAKLAELGLTAEEAQAVVGQ